MVVVVEGASPSERRAFVDALAERLDATPRLAGSVLARVDLEEFAPLVLLGPVPDVGDAGTDGSGYLVHPTLDAHYLVVSPTIPGTQQAHEVAPFVEAVRAQRDELLEGPFARAGLRAPLTGAAPLVVDEQAAIAQAIATTTGVTVLGILFILGLAFRDARLVGLALLPVAVGTLGAMAAARLLYGDLNMVTSSASSMLLGLGIDFGILLQARYLEQRARAQDHVAATRAAVRLTGEALALGALTTGLAFLTTATTRFTAYGRLGVIVAIGLVLMLVVTLLLTPPLMAILRTPPRPRPPPTPAMLSRAVRLAPGVVAFALVALLASAIALPSLRFNTRFWDFVPTHAESAGALAALESDPRVTPLRATIEVETIEDARVLAAQLRALPEVGRVFSPSDILPNFDASEIRLRALTTSWTFGERASELRQWANGIAERGAFAPEDLPRIVARQFVSLDGRTVHVQAVPAGDIWDPAVAARFARAVSAVAPEATGLPTQVDAHLRWIRDGFARAAALAAMLVFAVLAIALRSARDAVLAASVPAAGLALTLGLLATFGIPLDAASIVALPLLLGVGVDGGVHMIHRVREAEAQGGRATVADVVGGTGRAVALAAATTLAGFGSLLLADYGAMQSLGLTMAVGIVSCALFAVVVLPALLVALRRLD